MPVSNCSRYDSCVDCILARDPYCAWDFSTEQCSSVHSLPPSSDTALQSLKEGDVSQCPQPGTIPHIAVFTLIKSRLNRQLNPLESSQKTTVCLCAFQIRSRLWTSSWSLRTTSSCLASSTPTWQRSTGVSPTKHFTPTISTTSTAEASSSWAHLNRTPAFTPATQ